MQTEILVNIHEWKTVFNQDIPKDVALNLVGRDNEKIFNRVLSEMEKEQLVNISGDKLCITDSGLKQIELYV